MADRGSKHLAILAVAAFVSVPLAAEPDYRPYAALLTQHTYDCTLKGVRLRCLNYSALKGDGRWTGVVRMIATTKPSELKSYRERFAFYLNAYNVLAIDMILKHGPVDSIQKIPNVWKRPAGQVAGRSYSLDGLEKGVVRAFGDPRFHFALVCAALSCPDLRAEPYSAARLYRQLNSQTYGFLSNPTKGVELSADGEVRFSRLMDWYKADFQKKGGAHIFVAKYVKAAAGRKLAGWIPYHWELNGRW